MRKPEDLTQEEMYTIREEYNRLMWKNFEWPIDAWSGNYTLRCRNCNRSVGAITSGRLSFSSNKSLSLSNNYYVWVLKKLIYPHLKTREHENNSLLERLGSDD